MARATVEAGTETLVATPHLRSDFRDVHLHELAGRCQSLRTSLQAEAVPLRLIEGAEVSLLWALEATREELMMASVGQRGTDLLVETPMTTVSGIDQHLYHLRANGFRVTLAHPERSGEFQTDAQVLVELVNQGVLMQVNAKSLLESARRSASGRFARHLCLEGLVHIVASDGHRAAQWRPVTSLREGVDAAAAIVGADRATWMARDAPQAIVEGAELPEAPPLAAPRRRLFGRRA